MHALHDLLLRLQITTMKMARLTSRTLSLINIAVVNENNGDENSSNSSSNNNNVNISGGEFRTISLGIHAELATLRTALMLSTVQDKPPVQQARKPPQKDTALDIARQITNLEPEPLFVTVGNNGSDMYVVLSAARTMEDCGLSPQIPQIAPNMSDPAPKHDSYKFVLLPSYVLLH